MTVPQESLISTKRIVLPDGTIQIGEQFVEGRKVGEKQVGRGNAGIGTGAGSNMVKGNAIEEIYKRGVGPSGDYDIGLLGKMTGVTQEDVDNYGKTVTQKRLARTYDSQLETAGARKVQWGDDETTVQSLLRKAQEAKNLKKTEPSRVRTDEARARAVTNQQNRLISAENRAIRAENTEASRYERELLREDRKDARAALERAQNRKDTLELRRDNMNLEYARLAQADRQRAQERSDRAFMMLLQGLGSLGEAFTV